VKRFLFRCLLLAALAAFCAGCGKKEEEERQSLVLTVAETAEEDRRDTRASSADLDTVNGFRFEDCDEMVYCTGDGVKLRRKPGMDGEVAGYLEKGAYVHRIGKNSKWSRILRDGRRVYIAAEYLSPYPPETPPETTDENGRREEPRERQRSISDSSAFIQ